MQLDKIWIADHIPHHGAMCLLDEVVAFDNKHIYCRTLSHQNPENPMRAHGRLGAVCGIEFAAQAIAVHGAILAKPDIGTPGLTPPMGFLASVRSLEIQVVRLDDISSELEIEAEYLAGDGRQMIYSFTIRGEERLLLSGRTAVLLYGNPGLGALE